MKKTNLLWIGIGAALAAAAAFLLLRDKKSANEGEKPPRRAPQLDIENPGEQSEFTSAASESEIG